jgi:hypothetical protein
LQAPVKSSVSRPNNLAGDNGWLQKKHQPSSAVGMPISATKSANRRHERLAQLEMKEAANWAALIERDPDPVLRPPHDMAEQAQSIVRHD